MSSVADFDNDTGCLSFRGELTIYEANAASEHLCQAFASGGLRSVDLGGVTELDTAGLQILLLARRLEVSGSQTVALVNHSEAVREVFELAELEGQP